MQTPSEDSQGDGFLELFPRSRRDLQTLSDVVVALVPAAQTSHDKGENSAMLPVFLPLVVVRGNDVLGLVVGHCHLDVELLVVVGDSDVWAKTSGGRGLTRL